MSSEDFIKLMELYYFEKYEILDCKYTFNKETGESARLTLKKDDDEIILESTKSDFCEWVVKLKNVAKFNGTLELTPIKDSEKYYDDVKHLIDDGTKLSQAWKDVSTKKTKIDFDYNSYFHRLLHGDYDKHDENLNKLKDFYWEILSIKMYYAKNFLEIKNKPKDEYFHKYYDIIESSIHTALPFVSNLITKYRQFYQMIMFDVHISMEQLLIQYDIMEDLKDRITKEGGLNGNIAVRQVTDLYRRLCEACYNHLHSLHNIIVFSDEGLISSRKLSYIDLVNFFKNNEKLSELVEFLDPNIRHSESHLGTKYEYDRSGKIESILFHDTRNRKVKLVAKYDFKTLVYMMNRLKNALVPALYYTFVIYLLALELLIYKSKEYKFLLLRIGQM